MLHENWNVLFLFFFKNHGINMDFTDIHINFLKKVLLCL